MSENTALTLNPTILSFVVPLEVKTKIVERDDGDKAKLEVLQFREHRAKFVVLGADARKLRIERAYLSQDGESWPIARHWRLSAGDRPDVAFLTFDPDKALNKSLFERALDAEKERSVAGAAPAPATESAVEQTDAHLETAESRFGKSLFDKLRRHLQGIDEQELDNEVRRIIASIKRSETDRIVQALVDGTQVAFDLTDGEQVATVFLDLNHRGSDSQA